MRIDHRQRLRRRELRKLLPSNKDDLAAIDTIATHGYPAVEPLLADLLKWIRVESWPVAKPLREFLASIGSALTPHVQEALGSGDAALRVALLRHIVSQWPGDQVRGLSSQLFMIATDGQSWGADLLALRLLAQHGIGEPAWIAAWLDFKSEYHRQRLADVAEIAAIVKSNDARDARI